MRCTITKNDNIEIKIKKQNPRETCIDNKIASEELHIDTRDDKGNTLLMRSVKDNNFNIVKKCISLGADKDIINIDGESVLQISVNTKNSVITQYLIDNNINIQNIDICELNFIKLPLNIIKNLDKNEMYKKLKINIEKNNTNNIKFILKYFHDPEEIIKNKNLVTLLSNNNIEIIKKFIDYGVDVSNYSFVKFCFVSSFFVECIR